MSKVNRSILVYLLFCLVFLWGLIEWASGYDSFYFSNPPESRTTSSMETYFFFYNINKYLGKVGTTAVWALGVLYNVYRLYKAIKEKRENNKA